jgi:arylsulfatase A-like enzyme
MKVILLAVFIVVSQVAGFSPPKPPTVSLRGWVPSVKTSSEEGVVARSPRFSSLFSKADELEDTLVEAQATKPNILLFLVDQFRFPPSGYGSDEGFVDPLKQIFGFQGTNYDSNEFKKYYPGLWKLRENTVVLNNHRAASSACVPSRTVIFSGQYGTITGVTQTDGVFKSGASPDFPWLNGTKFPTIGDWLNAADYKSHYFGKWHVSGEATKDLTEYGFLDWELSYPDPHGTLPNNLGHYRDYQFKDLVTGFLRRQGLGIPYNIQHAFHNVANSNTDTSDDVPAPEEKPAPWFAVASFTNPHDIASYPDLPRTVNNKFVEKQTFTLGVPEQGAKAGIPKAGTMQIELNKLGLPQNNANVCPTWNETLFNKPSCQLDYAYKMGLTLTSKGGWNAAKKDTGMSKAEQLARAVKISTAADVVGIPFALTSNPELACRSFMQYYAYVISEVDQHINAVLEALEESGQADNTIVMFTADHGEYGGSHHMMMEKWHSAYEENTHVPFVVRFPQSIHQVPGGMKQISEPTNHADIMPTIMGFAGMNSTTRENVKEELGGTHSKTLSPVGADLSGLIKGESDTIIDPKTGVEREGVLFMTHDTISEPLNLTTAVSDMDDANDPLTSYDVYLEAVKQTVENVKDVAILATGAVRHPCLVHSVVNKANWKLVRYFGPTDEDTANEFELYDLNTDHNEEFNLVKFNKPYPTVVDSIPKVQPLKKEGIERMANEMHALLVDLEDRMLVEPPPTED